jgi:hypothetical protein
MKSKGIILIILFIGVAIGIAIADQYKASPIPDQLTTWKNQALQEIGKANTISTEDYFAQAQGAIDNRATNAPAVGTIYTCDTEALGNALDRPWIDENGVITFSAKPVIEGEEAWNSNLIITADAENRAIDGNGLPIHPTGIFPIDPSSDAGGFDANPNSISTYELNHLIPANPQIAEEPSCLPMGTIGIALSGGVFFNALDAEARDAVANEIFDGCEGHPQQNGEYHYHHDSPCFNTSEEKAHSPLIGYAIDGFGIYGPRNMDGKIVTNADLDDCHGHSEQVIQDEGSAAETYHYHVNQEFPYTLGCFTGEVDPTILEQRSPPPGGAPPLIQ